MLPSSEINVECPGSIIVGISLMASAPSGGVLDPITGETSCDNTNIQKLNANSKVQGWLKSVRSMLNDARQQGNSRDLTAKHSSLAKTSKLVSSFVRSSSAGAVCSTEDREPPLSVPVSSIRFIANEDFSSIDFESITTNTELSKGDLEVSTRALSQEKLDGGKLAKPQSERCLSAVADQPRAFTKHPMRRASGLSLSLRDIRADINKSPIRRHGRKQELNRRVSETNLVRLRGCPSRSPDGKRVLGPPSLFHARRRSLSQSDEPSDRQRRRSKARGQDISDRPRRRSESRGKNSRRSSARISSHGEPTSARDSLKVAQARSRSRRSSLDCSSSMGSLMVGSGFLNQHSLSVSDHRPLPRGRRKPHRISMDGSSTTRPLLGSGHLDQNSLSVSDQYPQPSARRGSTSKRVLGQLDSSKHLKNASSGTRLSKSSSTTQQQESRSPPRRSKSNSMTRQKGSRSSTQQRVFSMRSLYTDSSTRVPRCVSPCAMRTPGAIDSGLICP